MYYFKILRHAFLLGLLVCSHIEMQAGAEAAAPMGKGGFPMFSEQELKELEEFNKMIEEHVANELTPEEQAQFYKDVDDLTKMFESMTPEEFERFMGDMFNEQAPPSLPTPPTPDIQQPKEVLIPTLTGEQKQKIATILAVIDDIVKQIHTLLLQIASYPGLSNRIEKWGEKAAIEHWQTSLTWDTFKAAIEEFVNKLITAKEQDPETEVYKYLMLLIEDESLFNNLAQLQVTLNKEVPQIEVPELGIGILSDETKKAIQAACSKIAESLYVLTTPNALDELFAKFEPEALKLREAQEEARVRALEEAGRPLAPGYVVRAGVEPAEGYDSGYDYGYDRYSPYEPSYGYGPSYRPSRPTYEDREGRDYFGADEGVSPRKAPAVSEKKSSEKEKDKDKKEEKKEDKAIEINSDIERLLAKIANELDEIEEIITSDDRLELMHLYILEKEADNPVDTDLALRVITNLKKKIERTKSNIKVVKRKICNLEGKTLEHYKKELSKMIDEHEDLREFVENIKKISYKTATDKRNISNEKRWAYFADEDVLDTKEVKAQKLKEKVPSPLKITDIKTSVAELVVKIDCTKDKGPKEEEKKPKIEKRKKALKKRAQPRTESVPLATESTPPAKPKVELTPEQEKLFRE